MADLPLFPTNDDRETLKDILDIQRQLEAVLVKQKKVYEDVGHINLDLEHRVNRRYEMERKHLKDNTKDMEIMQREYLRMITVTSDVERKEAHFALEGAKQRIAIRKEEISLLNDLVALETEQAKRKFAEDTKWGNFMSRISKEVFGIKSKDYEMTKSIGQELQKYPFDLRETAGLIAVAITYLKGAYDLFLKFDKAAWEFRKAMGMTREDAKQFRATAEKLAIDFAHVGVTIEGAYTATLALREQMGSAYVISSDLVKNTAILAAQLGISENVTAGFLRNMAAVSKSTMQAQQDTVYMAASLAQAAGVPLNDVMRDVANRSTQTLTMMSRFPNTILRTAVEARRMNTTINEMAKASRSILDFSESVNAEMDASVLIGRSINLQRARELAYRRDIEGSTKEILRITKSIDFENLDVFQQEAFAKATGRSVDELLRMVQAERQWEKARRDPNLKGKVEDYEKLRRSNEANLRATAKNLELTIQQKSNQERITAIQQKWAQVMMRLQQYMLPIIDGFLSIIPPAIEFGVLAVKFGTNLWAAAKVVTYISDKMTAALMSAARYGKSTLTLFERWWVSLSKVTGFLSRIGGFIAKWTGLKATFGVFAKLGTWLKPVGEFFKTFGHALSGFKWVATLFKSLGKFTLVLNIAFAIWNVIKSIYNGVAKIGEGFGTIFGGGGVLKGLGQILHGLFKMTIGAILGIVEGFFGFIIDIPILILKGIGAMGVGWAKAAADWADSIWTAFKDFLGFSPSKLGLLILNGIESVGGMLFNAITSPFKMGYDLIVSTLSTIMPNFVDSVKNIGSSLFKFFVAPFRDGIAWIADKIPGMGKLADKIRGDNSVEARATAAYVPAVTVSPEGTKVAGAQAQQPQQTDAAKTEESNNAKTLQDILCAINSLNANLEAGKIGFYVDGQLLSATIARQSEFRGGYGVNKV